MSSKKSTRSAAPVSHTPKESPTEAAPAPPAPIAAPVTKAKTALAPAAPEKAAAARASKPKTSDLAPLTPRAARARTTKADLPVVVAPSQAAIVETPAPAAARVVTDEDIRVRAYFLSLEHRARGGSDIDFWLIAEQELRGAGPKG